MQDTPVVFLAGARQTGKSTLAQTLRPDATVHTFDDLAVLASAQADPEGFIASLGRHTVLDEVQRVPQLFVAIKASVDRDRRPGRFVLTGSANVLALPKVADSLVGRMEVLTLWPLSQAELSRAGSSFLDACFRGHPEQLRQRPIDRNDLLQRACIGGYPEVVARRQPEARARWFDAYLRTLIERDLRELSAIEGLAQVPRLLQTVAARVGSPLNVADLGRTLGIGQVTLRRYLTLFETLFLLVQLPPWFENLGKRLAKTPKLYLNDAGLLAHLLGVQAGELPEAPGALGAILENFAALELFKLAPLSAHHPGLFHLRTSTGHEVDLVLENRKRELLGIEVKAATTVSTSDFKSLRLFQEMVGKRLKCGVVLYTGREVLPFGPGLWAVPFQSLWA